MQPVVITLMVGGLAIALAAAAMAIGRAANAQRANTVLLKLLGTGQLEHVGKLCAVAPKSYLGAIHAATRAALAADRSDDGLKVEIAARDAFDAAAKQLDAAWRKRIYLGLLGVAVGAIGGGLAFATTPKPDFLVIAGCALLVGFAVHFLRGRRQLEHTLAYARHLILPQVITRATRPAD